MFGEPAFEVVFRSEIEQGKAQFFKFGQRQPFNPPSREAVPDFSVSGQLPVVSRQFGKFVLDGNWIKKTLTTDY
jgi:hypothetical protein